ncbi:MAG: orotidine-5'-phosphate decarboxylase [Candidatus Saccharimonadales bacterium]|jgi:orotidine-5'-phosphate decarboxylase
MERNFMQLLHARWDEGKFVCVGLDSDVTKLPKSVASHRDAQLEFNERIIDATHNLVCAYKPNLAFYSSSYGFEMLRQTIAFLNEHYPEIPVILDAKQADIGNTNNGYVLEDFTFFGADAVTVHPYLGMEAMKPFLDQKDKGVIVLVRTSNPGAGEFQDLLCEHSDWTREEMIKSIEAREGIKVKRLYQIVAHRVATTWNYNGNCAVVFGATYVEELAEGRKIVGDMPILIPGYGAQGGELEATVKAGADSKKRGMIINNSRGIIFASAEANFAETARVATQKMHDDITAVLATI